MFSMLYRYLLITSCLHREIWNTAIGRQFWTTWRRHCRVESRAIPDYPANDSDQWWRKATTRLLRSTRCEPSPFQRWKKRSTVCCIVVM